MGFETTFDLHAWAAVPFSFWAGVFFVFGCIVGSFLNVCIYRMPLDLSVVSPPSHCPHCKYAIPFYLNIPLITWLSLRGKCKNCRAPISPRYFAVELLTGLCFLACWLAFGKQSAGLALVYSLVLAGLIVATFIDFEHFIIPDEITLGGAAAGLIASFILPPLHQAAHWRESTCWSLAGIIVGAGSVYAVLRLGKLLFGRQKVKLDEATHIVFTETALVLPDQTIPYEEIFYRKSDTIIIQASTIELVDRGYSHEELRLTPARLQIGDEILDPATVPHVEVVCSELVLPREAMGFGDVKFMAAIGAFLGWQGALFSLMASSVIGSIVGIILIACRRREWSSRMPYGPYIAAAAVIWLFAGRRIMDVLFPVLNP